MARLDYVNARLAARRTRLMGAPGLRELLALPTLEARIELIRQRAYAPLPEELGPDPIARVEAALREGWRREAASLVDDAEGARARALLAAFVALGEAAAVKAVLRGVARGLPPERTVAAAFPAPGLGEEALRTAASAEGLDAAVEALSAAGSELATFARGALAAREPAGLLPLEIAVDRAALARARGACRRRGADARLLLRHVEDRADARNAATLLALAGTEPAADLFVAGGRRLGEAVFRHLAGAPVTVLHAAMVRLFAIADRELASPWSADRAMERALAAPLRREARRNPLSIAVPLSYLADREAEVRRVALVLRGAALGLEGAEILELAEA